MNASCARRRPSVLAIALLLLLVAACETVVETPTTLPSPTERPSVDVMAGGIEGVVRDPDGEPIADALVLITTPEFSGTARTTEQGTFSSRGVSGTFTIVVSGLDWVEETRTITVEPGELVEVEFVLQPRS